jgi:hypothetical protein
MKGNDEDDAGGDPGRDGEEHGDDAGYFPTAKKVRHAQDAAEHHGDA